MPDTELFRDELLIQLQQDFSDEEIEKILRAFDNAAKHFEIKRESTDLTITNGLPEEVKWFIASKAIANCSQGTINQYKYKLINFFGVVQKGIREVTANDIRLYLYWYKTHRNVNNHTLNHTRIVLNAFFGWCVNEGNVIDKNPAATVEKIKYQEPQRQPLTAYELEELRWNCDNIREKALIDFLFSTGLRISECANVKLSDINWGQRSVVVQHGKGDKARIVFFNAESELTLRKYLETRDDDCDGLFVSTRKPIHAIGTRALENIVTAIGKRAGIHAFPHKLRHTFATIGLNSGMPIEKLQKLLGHVKPETTLIYAKLDQVDLQLEHRRIYQ